MKIINFSTAVHGIMQPGVARLLRVHPILEALSDEFSPSGPVGVMPVLPADYFK